MAGNGTLMTLLHTWLNHSQQHQYSSNSTSPIPMIQPALSVYTYIPTATNAHSSTINTAITLTGKQRENSDTLLHTFFRSQRRHDGLPVVPYIAFVPHAKVKVFKGIASSVAMGAGLNVVRNDGNQAPYPTKIQQTCVANHEISPFNLPF